MIPNDERELSDKKEQKLAERKTELGREIESFNAVMNAGERFSIAHPGADRKSGA